MSQPHNFVSDEQLRAEAIRELGLQGLSPQTQDEVMLIVRETLAEYINIAVLKALGPEGVEAMMQTEGTPESFDKKLAELLPNIGDIVKQAIQDGIAAHQAAAGSIRKRFGLPESE